MYFAEIFRRLASVFPGLSILVNRDVDATRYPDLPLDPSLSFGTLPLTRIINGVPYEVAVGLPTLRSVRSFFWRKVDLVVTIEFTPIAVIAFLCFRLWRRKPLLLLVENSPSFRRGHTRGAVLFVKRFIARRATLVMTNNDFGHEFIRDILGVKDKRIFTAPYLTSVPPQRPLDAQKLLPAESVPNTLNLLFINSITKRKGLAQLVEALARLTPANRKKATLHVAGDGPELADIMAIVNERGLSGQLIRYGHVNFADIGCFYEIADVFVSPTLGDYRSLAGFEALSCGKPLLMSKFDGAAMEVVREGENGFIIDPTNPEEFAGKIQWFIDNPNARTSMSAVSHELARSFSYERVVENIKIASLKCVNG
jgi:glycosyltransferase involved in cell wall biosynthesis